MKKAFKKIVGAILSISLLLLSGSALAAVGDAQPKYTIEEVYAPDDIFMHIGGNINDYLPAVAFVERSDGVKEGIPVDWDLSTFDNQVSDFYVIEGTFTLPLPGHLENPKDCQPLAFVFVEESDSLIKTEAKAATCTAEGNLEYWTCPECGGVFSDAAGTVPTTIEAQATAKLPHTPGEWEVVTPATEEKEGLRRKLCTACGKEVETETIPKLPPAPNLPGVPESSGPHFTDVDLHAWYADAVRYVTKKGLLNGYGDGRFGPNHILSRAQLTQVLYNRDGKPPVEENSSFSDVAASEWYSMPVAWAAANGIACGYGDGRFGPYAPVTREQMTVILYRYAGSPQASPDALGSFADGGKVSGWAEKAMAWAVGEGIVTGKENRILDPQGNATRGEAAAIFARLAG